MTGRLLIILIMAWLGVFAPARLFCAPADVQDATTRVVSLVPNITEIAFAMNAGDQVVGVSDYCFYPADAQTRPKVGGLLNPNLETVVRMRPDVVFLFRNQGDFAARLRALGIQSELFAVDTLAELYAAVDRVGVWTGKTREAEELVGRIRRELDELRDQDALTSAGIERPRGVLIVSRDPAGLRNMYQATFLGELFELVGGRLAASGRAGITTEELIRANPDLIIDFSYAEPVASARDTVTTAPTRSMGPWQRLTTVTAVKSGHVYRWSDPHVLLLGPGVVDTARKMKELISDVTPAGGE